jgi:hypothetical protein
MIMLALLASGTTMVWNGAKPTAPAAPAVKAPPADLQVQIASAPAGVTLPVSVESIVTIDRKGDVASCALARNGGPAAFGPVACQQVKTMAPFPVAKDEYGHAMNTVRKITVSFDTSH